MIIKTTFTFLFYLSSSTLESCLTLCFPQDHLPSLATIHNFLIPIPSGPHIPQPSMHLNVCRLLLPTPCGLHSLILLTSSFTCIRFTYPAHFNLENLIYYTWRYIKFTQLFILSNSSFSFLFHWFLNIFLSKMLKYEYNKSICSNDHVSVCHFFFHSTKDWWISLVDFKNLRIFRGDI